MCRTLEGTDRKSQIHHIPLLLWSSSGWMRLTRKPRDGGVDHALVMAVLYRLELEQSRLEY